jgi:hypothetical protein
MSLRDRLRVAAPWLLACGILLVVATGTASAQSCPENDVGEYIKCKFPYGTVVLPNEWCFHAEGERHYNWWPYVEANKSLEFARVRYAIRIPVRYVQTGQLGSSIFVGFEFTGDTPTLPLRILKPKDAPFVSAPAPLTCDLKGFIETALRDNIVVSIGDVSKTYIDEGGYRWWYFLGRAHSVKRVLRIPVTYQIFNEGGGSTNVAGHLLVSYGGGAGP